ncbi:hypothetical protein BHE74_00050422, partial [Ensete ventricosum]
WLWTVNNVVLQQAPRCGLRHLISPLTLGRPAHFAPVNYGRTIKSRLAVTPHPNRNTFRNCSSPPSRLGGLATTTATMPGINVPAAAAASIPSPAHSFAFDEDDGFGDFKFASSVQPFPSHPPPPTQQQQQDDDDWGDFVVSPLGSHPVESPSPTPLFDAFPPLYAAAADKIAGVKQWEKPRGALPLSIFGEEEEEVDEPESLHPPVLFPASLSSSIPAEDRKGPVPAHGELRDLITSLYGQAPRPVGGDNDGLCLADDSDESSWEYKDASSSSPNSVLKVMIILISMMGFLMVAAWFNFCYSFSLIDHFLALFFSGRWNTKREIWSSMHRNCGF